MFATRVFSLITRDLFRFSAGGSREETPEKEKKRETEAVKKRKFSVAVIGFKCA